MEYESRPNSKTIFNTKVINFIHHIRWSAVFPLTGTKVFLFSNSCLFPSQSYYANNLDNGAKSFIVSRHAHGGRGYYPLIGEQAWYPPPTKQRFCPPPPTHTCQLPSYSFT